MYRSQGLNDLEKSLHVLTHLSFHDAPRPQCHTEQSVCVCGVGCWRGEPEAHEITLLSLLLTTTYVII